MEQRQQARLSTLARIPAFLDDYVIELGQLKASRSAAALSAVVRELTAHRDTQAGAVVERRSCTMRRQELRRELRTKHMRPIAAIAKVELINAPPAYLCPASTLRDELLLAHAEAMGQRAARNRNAFLRHQVDEDFVEHMRSTIDALDGVIEQSERCRERRKAATAALASGFRRARRAVSILDALVEAQAYGNSALLAAWRTVLRRRAEVAARDRTVADAA